MIIDLEVVRTMDTVPFGEFMHRRRAMLRLTQSDLATRVGVSQRAIEAIEAGRREPSETLRGRITDALAMYPSLALERHAAEVVDVFTRRGLQPPKVFGSIVRGTERPTSDIDLLVPLVTGPGFRFVDLFDMERELERMLTFEVNIVDDSQSTPSEFLARARAESIPVT